MKPFRARANKNGTIRYIVIIDLCAIEELVDQKELVITLRIFLRARF